MSYDLSYINIYFKYFFNKEVDVANLSDMSSKSIQEVLDVVFAEIFNSKMGYPLGNIIKDASFEERFLSLSKKILNEDVYLNQNRPRLILTHDVDYINCTLPYLLKTIVGRRRLRNVKNETFLNSLEEMLSFEESLGLKSICFIPVSGDFATSSLKEWLINPSYKLYSKYGLRLKEILLKYKVEVGLHGSVGSLNGDRLRVEKEYLEKWIENKVFLTRQHWLDIPSDDFFEKLYEIGIKKDFTVGWNGQVGFRSGFMREFPIPLKNGEYIEEVPLTLMDGVLFDELKLSHARALERSKEIIDVVAKNKGDLVLNWHGRTFSKNYGWGKLYKELINYALSKGFVQ